MLNIIGVLAVFCLPFLARAENNSLKKNQGSTEEDMSVVGQVPEKMVFLAGIIRIYKESLKQNPKDVPLRQRFIEFLMSSSQEKKALAEMKILQTLTPDDGALAKRIEILDIKFNPKEAQHVEPKGKG